MTTFYLDPVNGDDTKDGKGFYLADFTSGGTYEIQVGDTVTDDTTAKTALVALVTVTSGTWAGGDAAGSLYVWKPSGAFTANGTISVGVNSNVATLTADFAINSWKTITNGATAARIAPGDTIKLPKSPDPVSIGSLTWTNNNATITIPSGTILDISTCETDWTPSANIGAAAYTSYYTQGSKCIRIIPTTAFTTGLAAYKDVSTLDLSGYTKVSFYVKGSGNIAANVWRLDLCTNNDGTGAVHSFTLPAISQNNGGFITFDNGAALNSAIKSVALVALSDPGTTYLYIDNIIACNTLTLTNVIATSADGPWFPILSLSGTTLTMGALRSYAHLSTKYPLATDTYTTYARECLQGWGYSGYTLQESGTEGNLISYIGGYDTSTGEQNGVTWINPFCSNLFYGAVHYNHFENVHAMQANLHDNGSGAKNISIKNVSTAGGEKLLSGGAYIYTKLLASGKIVITGAGGFFSASQASYDIRIGADIDIYAFDSFTLGLGLRTRYTGKIRCYALAGIWYALQFSGYYSGHFKEIEIIGGAQYAVSIGSSGDCGNISIDKLTLSGNVGSVAVFSQLAEIDIGYLDADNTPSIGFGSEGRVAIQRWLADGRYKARIVGGYISDHITGGQADAWAYSGEGLSLLLNPVNEGYPSLIYNFHCPVTTGTTYQVHFQKRKTSAGANCTLKFNASGCGITPIWDEAVTLTDSWSEHISASFTPTYSGYVRCEFQALDGSTTGDIGIDDIHLQVV